MCFSGGGSSGSRNARNSQLTTNRRQLSTSSVTGFTQKGEWGNETTSTRLEEIKAKPVTGGLGQTYVPRNAPSSAQLAQSILDAQSKPQRTAINGFGTPSNETLYSRVGAADPTNIPKQTMQGLALVTTGPQYSYADASGKALARNFKNNYATGTTRTIDSTDAPKVVIKDGKGYYEYTTKTQTYTAAGTAKTSPNALNRQGNIDPSAALKATRVSRGAGLRIVQGASTAKAKRGGGLRIDNSGVNASSGGSGINVG